MLNTIVSIPPYARLVRFASTDAARLAYQAVQDFIFRHEEVELSVYNLVVAQVPHVVVLGEQPGAALDEQISYLLADGVATHLPSELVRQLAARRGQQEGPWSERHPGLPGERLS